jgi:hypothetical protein
MTRCKWIRVTLTTALILTILAWCYSAFTYNRLAYGRGHACAGVAVSDGVFTVELFSSTTPFTIGPKLVHETRSWARFWPSAASGPEPPHMWQGLGYVSRHFSDGSMFGIIVPFWLVLLLLSAFGMYVFRRPTGSPPTIVPSSPQPTRDVTQVSTRNLVPSLWDSNE